MRKPRLLENIGEDLFDVLTEQEKRIIGTRRRKSRNDVAKVFGISAERVRQIETAAIQKLNKAKKTSH